MHDEAAYHATQALETALTHAHHLSADEQTVIQKALQALQAFPEIFERHD
jgi:hypothetical protein